ncbi:MAG: HD domain-containing phosphohydrolase [Lachnospiraceae bacterium]
MFKKIKIELIGYILPIIILLAIGSFMITFYVENQSLNDQIEAKMQNNSEMQTMYIQQLLNETKTVANDLSKYVENTYQYEDLATYEAMMESIVSSRDNIFGIGIWFEPFAYNEQEVYVGPFVYKIDEEVFVTYDYSNEDYNYMEKPYYDKAYAAGDTIYTEIYFDETSSKYLLTCSTPMFQEQQFIGCVSIDLEASNMVELIRQFNSKENRLYILDEYGYYIASTDMEHLQSPANIMDSENESFVTAMSTAMKGGSGFTSYQKDDEIIRVYYSTLEDQNWIIINEIPESVMFEPVDSLILTHIVKTLISLLLLGGVSFFAMHQNVEKPIKILENECYEIAEQNFENGENTKLIERSDEIGDLAEAFEAMKHKVKSYQNELESQNSILISQQKNLSDLARYNEAIVNAIPDIIFLLSEGGIVIDCMGIEKNMNISKDHVIGISVYNLLSTRNEKDLQAMIAASITTNCEQSQQMEVVIREKAEWMDIRVAVFTDGQLIAVCRNITETLKQKEKVDYLSTCDQMTGLNNRESYHVTWNQFVVSKLFPLSVIITNINGLKLINHSFGNSVGDELIRSCAEVYKNSYIPKDQIFRISGDEFAILLPNCAYSNAEMIANDLKVLCEKETVNGIALTVEHGIGVMKHASERKRDIIKQAEEAMYRNKLYGAPGRRAQTIELIISTLQAKNPREQLHSERVAMLCQQMAEALDMTEAQISRIHSAGLLHDIGKIGVREDILNKPGRLTNEEYENMCSHAEIGYKILQSAGNMDDISEFAYAHHERWDGKGYPRQLKEEQIPLESRIIAIADTYDAMTSDRSYRNGLSKEVAIEEIKRCAGTQFDPSLVDIFVNKVL